MRICGVPSKSNETPLSFRYSKIPAIGVTAFGKAASTSEKLIWKSSYPFFLPSFIALINSETTIEWLSCLIYITSWSRSTTEGF